jgi:hypothetical protein
MTMDVRFSRSRRGAAVIAVGWLEDGLLTARAIHVGMWLSSHTPEYLGKMSQNQIKERLGTGWDTIQRAFDELEAQEIITREVVADGRTRARTVITFDLGRWTSPPDSPPEPFPVSGQPVPRSGTTAFPVTGEPLEVLQEEGRELSKESSRGELETTVAQRRRNELFDACVEACGWNYEEMTKRQRQACGVAVSELRCVGATGTEILRRAQVFKRVYPNATLTPNALANQWAAIAKVPESGPQINNSTQAFLNVARKRGLT